MTTVCFRQRTWNCSHRKAAGDSWGITGHSAWRENNPICLLVEHIFHLYRMKKTKTFLVVAAVSVSVPAKQRLVFHLKLTLSTLCCNLSGTRWYICLICYRRRHRIRVIVHFVPLIRCWESPDWITHKKNLTRHFHLFVRETKLWNPDGWS